MALGRTSNLVGSDIHFHGVTIYGCATEASFYGVATDGLQFDKGSYIRKTCGGALRVVYLSQSDDLSFGGMTASTSLAMDLSGLDIEDQSSSPSAVPIQIEQGAAKAGISKQVTTPYRSSRLMHRCRARFPLTGL